jgi:hypothetical protein
MGMNWDRVPSSILVCEQSVRIKLVNSSFVQKVMDYPSITSLLLWEIVADEDVAKLRTALTTVAQDGDLQVVTFDLLLLQRNGFFPQLRSCEAHVQADGDVLVLSILLSPVNKRTAKAAQVTEALDYLMHAPAPLQMMSTSGQVLWANSALLAQLECTPQEYIGKHVQESTAAPFSDPDSELQALKLRQALQDSSDLLLTKTSGESAAASVDATIPVDRRCRQRGSAR